MTTVVDRILRRIPLAAACYACGRHLWEGDVVESHHAVVDGRLTGVDTCHNCPALAGRLPFEDGETRG